MSDCSKCAERVELHPEYRKLAYEKTPCAKCKGNDPTPIGLPFNDSLMAVFNDPTRENRFRDFIKRFTSLTARQRDVCWFIHDNPGLSVREYAVGLKLPRATMQRCLREILRAVPEFSSSLPKPAPKAARFTAVVGM